jgi:putative Holliday junction resolvase
MEANNLLGVDVGEKRIGIARVNMIARLPEALTALHNDESFAGAFQALIDEYQPDILVVGLPRNLQGQETAQSAYVRAFSQESLLSFNIPVVFQDETLSSRVAEERLQGRPHTKGDIDAQAALVILEDYLQTL